MSKKLKVVAVAGGLQKPSRTFALVSSIVEELAIRLDHEGGGELVLNLTRIYDWWLKELFEASQKNQPERLEALERQIAEMKAAWAELDQRQGTTQQPAFSPQGMVG